MSTLEARSLIRAAIITLVRAGGGQMVTRPLLAGDPDAAGMVTEPEPLAAIRAAHQLAVAVQRAVRHYAHDAREDGHGWGRIGEALGFADDPGPGMTSIAERAFLAVASDLGSGPVFPWTCPACRQTVLDGGPEAGHPEDQERGHGEGCARMAEAVRDWKAQWEDEGDG